MPGRVKADLKGVPETALWTLYHRAAEAARPDTVLPDPRAVQLLTEIEFPFRERMGAARPWLAQAIALRALGFDRVVRAFLADRPDGTVVALGEGLETQFWRVDNGRAQWVTVDLNGPLALRKRVLPHGARQRLVACDARDSQWMADIDPSRGVLVTAQGLLMYLQPAQVTRLIAACADAFPGGTMVFDTVSRRFSTRTRTRTKGPGGHRLPPMPWGMDAVDRDLLRQAHPAISEVSEVPLPAGRGFIGYLAPRAAALPLLRTDRPLITRLRFGAAPASLTGQP
ncbi:class I SAM-dependent methyltransferase [Streptomyces libani]|uniref:Class I SAM-dependent methyltransferase n=2 Tax=Streptomyces nigrescens TaxID=1920 RepID=A0A640TCY6_STRNI|nr:MULTISPECIES: class I SAM-dependent methyltransferase [Streptomyces]MCX5447075.1 class I SAM-dependent methyltransferase [Streptomyces libani]WAT95762.1 class I SAM-dependent methyltransferase [Streptomyces libani subsp. libani]WAU03386.1 class I SAM-dependent methyltransferase [Streptomyces nigrescens]WDT58616.1 class I SAM-dependent methyltransferase [Streptomyces sp. G7(2002)]GFE21034.1 putative O-methyltransferase OMT [Streptomyces libani subsp. libani]